MRSNISIDKADLKSLINLSVTNNSKGIDELINTISKKLSPAIKRDWQNTTREIDELYANTINMRNLFEKTNNLIGNTNHYIKGVFYALAYNRFEELGEPWFDKEKLTEFAGLKTAA